MGGEISFHGGNFSPHAGQFKPTPRIIEIAAGKALKIAGSRALTIEPELFRISYIF
jgi:hypothetical protein